LYQTNIHDISTDQSMYELRLAQDRVTLQAMSQGELARLPAAIGGNEAGVVREHIGAKLGEFSLLGSTFYDIAHHGKTEPTDPNRLWAARNSGLMMGVLELMDNTVDHNGIRDTAAIGAFYANCFNSLTDSQQPELVRAIPLPGQVASYSLACYVRNSLAAEQPSRRQTLQPALATLHTAALKQFDAQSPEVLLHLVEDIHGSCTEIVTVPCEFADTAQYPAMRRAAWHFGAIGCALDNGSEVLEDIREGAKTYATALIELQGLSNATLRDIAAWRDDSVSSHYAQGKAALESNAQRRIFSGAVRALRIRYILKRLRGGNSLQKIEAVLAERQAAARSSAHQPLRSGMSLTKGC
jgi:hypothetical protein